MGRHYYRPHVVSSDEVSQTVHHKRSEIRDDSRSTSTSTPSKIPNVNGALTSDSLTNLMEHTNAEPEQTWESHLIPLEPKPEFYDTFEGMSFLLLKSVSLLIFMHF